MIPSSFQKAADNHPILAIFKINLDINGTSSKQNGMELMPFIMLGAATPS